MLRSRINLSTSGGTEILNSVITHTSLTDLVAVGKVSDGDWITVRWPTRFTFHATRSLPPSRYQREIVGGGQDVRDQE